MPKIVWLDQNKVMEVQIPERGFMSLGRGKDNDIVLSDPQISRKHARMVAGPHGCLLKDLSNSKSLVVNGAAVNSRFLQNGDIIRIGNHVLEYLAEESKQTLQASVSPAGGLNYSFGGAKKAAEGSTHAEIQRAFLRYISGPAQGHIQTIDRPLLPIGDPNGTYAAVSQRTNGYHLLNLGKDKLPLVNEVPVSGSGTELQNGDIISLGKDRIEFKVFEKNKA